MSRDNSQPLERGQTLYQGETPNSADLQYGDALGVKKFFVDYDFSVQGAKPLRTTHLVEAILCRNVYGSTIVGKTLVQLSPDLLTILKPTDAANTDKFVLGVVDEWLGSSGVHDDDVCWVVRVGPTKSLVSFSGGAAVGGERLVSNTSGKLVKETATPADATAARADAEAVAATAMAAAGTGATDSLVYMRAV